MTPKQFFEAVYVPDRLPAANQDGTREAYRVALNNLARYSDGTVAIADLSDETLKTAMARMVAAGRSIGSANSLYRHVCAVWRMAADKGYCQTSPKTKKYREPEREPEGWMAPEVSKLLEAAAVAPGNVGAVPASVFWSALLLTALSTAARISAVMAAKTRKLDLTRGEIMLPANDQKHRHEQRLGLYPSAVGYLQQLAPHGRVDTVFGDWEYDRTVKPWPALTLGLRKIIVAAGLRESMDLVDRLDLFHRLRKTTASEVANVAGESAAQGLLGHSSSRVTARYLDKRIVQTPTIRDWLPDPLATGIVLPDTSAGLRLYTG